MGIDNMIEDNVVYFKNLTSVYWKAFMIQEKKSKEYYNEDMHAVYSGFFFFFWLHIDLSETFKLYQLK